MSFGAMAAWQALLLMAVAVAAAVYLFRLRVRPPKIAVPSLLLWRKVLDQKRDLSWWERVRRAVSLVATALVALALAVAVTRPGPRVTAASRGRLLIVLDSSWSMRAKTTGSETRWRRAVAEAKALAQSAAGDEVAVATTADGLVEGPTSDTALIETALDRLSPAGGEGTAWPRIGNADQVHFFTDGAIARPNEPGVVVHSVYVPVPTVGITAFGVRPPTSATDKAHVYLEVVNYASEAQDVRVLLTRGEASLVDQTIKVGAGETLRQAAPIEPQAGGGALRAKVSARGNALDVDDESVAWMASAEPLNVTVVSEQPGAVALLLQRDPGVKVTMVAPSAYRPGSERVVVFDRWVPAEAPATPALVIAPPASSWIGRPGAEERTPRWSERGDHPVLAGVDPLTLDIKRAHGYEDGGLLTIAASEKGTPVVAVQDSPTRRSVVLTFTVADSNFAFAPAFPVLIGNAVEWLARPALAESRRPGPMSLPLSTTRVVAPDGAAVPLIRTEDRAVARLDMPGLYHVQAAGSDAVVPVNVGGPELSNLTRTTLSDELTKGSGGERAAGRPWWMYGIFVAFVLAAAEWGTWQRRITV